MDSHSGHNLVASETFKKWWKDNEEKILESFLPKPDSSFHLHLTAYFQFYENLESNENVWKCTETEMAEVGKKILKRYLRILNPPQFGETEKNYCYSVYAIGSLKALKKKNNQKLFSKAKGSSMFSHESVHKCGKDHCCICVSCSDYETEDDTEDDTEETPPKVIDVINTIALFAKSAITEDSNKPEDPEDPTKV